MGRPLFVHSITRVDQRGTEESLEFRAGINLIIGLPNTGKTQWLKMLDFVLGSDDRAEDAFDEELAAKYVELRADITIADKRLKLSRRWHDPGTRTKIVVDGAAINIDEFSRALLEWLGIPEVRFPQGDPYSPRTWPTLGWRLLLRHIYRRQGAWSDIVSRQPDSDQHAALVQFLGVADKIFITEYRDLVSREKQMELLRLQKEHYQDALAIVTRELLDTEAVTLTDTVLNDRIATLNRAAAELATKRTARLESIRSQASTEASEDVATTLAETLASLRVTREELLIRRSDARTHLAEVEEHRGRLSAEIARLTRARLAGTVFGRLRVSHCPVCDQVVRQESLPGECYLCHQHTEPVIVTDAKRRFAQEEQQLEGELGESDDLIARSKDVAESLERDLRRVNEQIRGTESSLAPLRARAASIFPAELGELDREHGAVQERIRQMEGFRAVLAKRQELAQQLDDLQREIGSLEGTVDERRGEVELAQLGDHFADQMNDYLSKLKVANPHSWTQRDVRVDLHARATVIRVGDGRWHKKLGGTLTLYFLLAYNYALLALFPETSMNYPGLAILDFPAKLEDGTATADKENFVLVPFSHLLSQDEMAEAQVIVTGSSFVGFDAHRIELSHVWL